MIKVAEVIRFYSLNEITDYIEKGGEYPLHHIWCYDKIKQNGMSVDCIEYNKNSRLNRFGNKINIFNLQQQLNLLKRSKKFDIIYAPFIADVLLILILKLAGLYRKPVYGLAFLSYVPFKKNIIKRLRQKILRYIYLNGTDYLLFQNELIYIRSNKYKPLNSHHGYMNYWGADFDFFDKYIRKQTETPAGDFIYTTGSTGRDFNTLFEAFKEIDFSLKITTKIKLDNDLEKCAPDNIIIDNTVKPGLYSVGLIRKEYYNSLAVAIPLSRGLSHSPVGSTVLMEALAMARPVISTYNSNYPFNLEKEKVGFYVDVEDVKGWRDIINYMIENPGETKEMGLRGQYLCKTKYNYDRFSEEVVAGIERLANGTY